MTPVAELMSRYCDGDSQAFRELYDLVAPRLYQHLVELSHDRGAAAVALEAAFLKVHRSRAAYIRGSDPLAWFYAIARRAFVDHRRTGMRRSAA